MPPAPAIILVTRPQPEADRLCVKLQTQGLKAVASPLISIEYPACPSLEYHNIQALIATSKNGLRALSRSQYKRFFLNNPLFTVGQGTALFAKTQGFSQIYEGKGTASDLPELIRENCATTEGSLFHLAGSHLSWDLKGALEQAGFDVIAPIIYHARAEEKFSGKVLSQLAMGQVSSVILMSPRIAKIFISLITQGNLACIIESLHFYCLSEKVSEVLTRHYPDISLKISTAKTPTQDELLSLISIPVIKV